MTANGVLMLVGEHKIPWIWCHKLGDAMEEGEKWFRKVLGKQ